MDSESQRIHWQQWVIQQPGDSAAAKTDNVAPTRKLVTSSASVRMWESARAIDVTKLLRDTLKLDHDVRLSSHQNDANNEDSLVLVGTLESLPSGYVKFPAAFTEGNGPDTYHLVKTLPTDAKPMDVKASMMVKIKELINEMSASARTSVSWKLQWFFIPGRNDVESLIPNCIELEGHSSPLDSPSTPNSTQTSEEDTHEEQDQISWESYLSSEERMCMENIISHDCASAKKEKRSRSLQTEDQMRMSIEATAEPQRVRGYLLKRSPVDSHAWETHYCVLTDEFFWCVSRERGGSPDAKATYEHIKLENSLLIQPSSEYAPLFRIPFAFEFVTGQGTSHMFRASSKREQQLWCRAISLRLSQSSENGLLGHTDLILGDECTQHHKRLTALIVEPVKDLSAKSMSDKSSLVASYVVWCLKLASFKTARGNIESREDTGQGDLYSVSHLSLELWNRVELLLAEAKAIADRASDHPVQSIASHCRHIDFLLHGRVRSYSGSEIKVSSREKGKARDFPTADIFDLLLGALQKLILGSDG